MTNNPYAPPRAELAEPVRKRAVGKIAYLSVCVGMLSGVVAAVVPWMWAKPGEPFSRHAVPLVIGILTAVVHAATLVRLRKRMHGAWPVSLLVANALVLSIFVAMIVYLINIRAGHAMLPWIATSFTLF